MRILDRYIALKFLSQSALSILGLTLLYLFQSMLVDLIDGKNTIVQNLTYHLLGAPQIMIQLLPPALMIATLLTLSGLNRSHELAGMLSIGVSIRRIASVIMAVVVCYSCAVLVFEDRILPPLYKRRFTYYQREIRKRQDFFFDVKQNKIWYRSKNLIYNLQVFDPKQNAIIGMSIYTFNSEFQLVQVIEAEKALYTDKQWRLTNGIVTLFTEDDPFPMTQKFTSKVISLPESPADFSEIEKEVDGLRLKELFHYIERIREAGVDTRNYEVKFHSKLSLALVPLLMSLIAVPFSTRNRREGGMAKDLGMCLAITFFYWLFYSLGLSLGTNGIVAPWIAAWFPSVIFGVACLIVISPKVRWRN